MLADIAAIAFWPLAAIIALLWRIRMLRPVPQPAWAILENGLAALLVIAMGAWIVGGNVSTVTVLDFHIGFLAIGVLFLSFPWIQKCRSMFGVGCLGIAAFGFLLFALGAQYLIGDHLLPKQLIQGRIQNLGTEYSAKGPTEFVVKINDQEFKATTRTFKTLRVGEDIRAEVGKGSGYIYRLEHVPAR